MAKRIIRKVMAVNNPNDKRIVYVVDGVYIFPKSQKNKAIAWTKKYDSKGRLKK